MLKAGIHIDSLNFLPEYFTGSQAASPIETGQYFGKIGVISHASAFVPSASRLKTAK